MSKMRQAKLVGLRKIELQEREIPKPNDNEVLIQVKWVGICGSDIHAFKGEHPFVHPPIVLGHEFSGVVWDTGSRVSTLKKGDRVTVEPNLTCGKCYNCRHGRYNICTNLRVIGCVGYDGALAEYIAIPEEKTIKIPDTLSFEEAALIEPVAVAIHAVRISGQKIGDRVLILGAGTIGLFVMQAARLTGAKQVLITDLLDYRLELAKNLGADNIINARLKDPVKFIHQSYGKEGIDLIYECVGLEKTISQAIEVARKGTRVIIVGVPAGKINTNLAYVQDRELELVGSLMYTRKDFLTAIELIQKEKIKVKPLISHKFTLKEVDKAFKTILEGRSKVLKVLIQIE